jgi:hypothetical protein
VQAGRIDSALTRLDINSDVSDPQAEFSASQDHSSHSKWQYVQALVVERKQCRGSPRRMATPLICSSVPTTSFCNWAFLASMSAVHCSIPPKTEMETPERTGQNEKYYDI